MDRRWIAPALLFLAGAAAYHNSFHGVFLFDDFRHIVENDRIRDLSHPLQVLSGTTRPLTALTFAFNYAAGGLNVWGYHAVNFGIHWAAGLALFALLLRHLKPELAFFASLIWMVHPLQTQPVNYIVQRSELLMGLFYLLTLCFLGKNKVLCVICCALGMASKPIMATAPILALLYDRFFLAPSWQEVWRRRGRLHLGLLATYGVLAVCLLNGPEEYVRDVGFNLQQVRPESYLLSQGPALLHYLRLAVWPKPLVFDYGEMTVTGAQALLPWLIILFLLAITGWAVRNKPTLGFLGAGFFLILAPTSSFIPISDPVFEHRMYLSLAAPAVLFVLATHRLIRSRWAWVVLLSATVFGLGFLTVQRNADYRSAVGLWRDTLSKRPGHPRAHNDLGAALHLEGKLKEALAEYRTALRLNPGQADTHNNLGFLLDNLGDGAAARREYETALHLQPTHRKAAGNLALLLHREGLELTRQARWKEAEQKLSAALLWNPDDADLWNNLGTVEDRRGKRDQAILYYTQAFHLAPNSPLIRKNLQKVLQRKIFTPP